MSKPIYRYLAEKKWRLMKRKVLVQRITQMKVIPDVYPSAEPVLDIDIIWNHRVVPPGDYVLSSRSESAPTLKIQSFNSERKMVTIVAIDSDIPNVEKDSFDYRCHGIWSNIPLTPTISPIRLSQLEPQEHTILPWTPPYALKGSPYHRISFFVFEQPNDQTLNTTEIAKAVKRDNFILRSFVDKQKLVPQVLGVTMFRSQWDEQTASVMERAGIEGAELEMRNKKAEKLPEKYKRKDGARYRGFA